MTTQLEAWAAIKEQLLDARKNLYEASVESPKIFTEQCPAATPEIREYIRKHILNLSMEVGRTIEALDSIAKHSEDH